MSVHNRLWRRWHRWFGVLLALPVLVLAITGLILNHADRLVLAQRVLPPVLAELYGPLPSKPVQGMRTGEGMWLMHGDVLASPQGARVACTPPFHGVILQESHVIAGCGEELLLLSSDGAELERLGTAWGVPPFSGLGTTTAGALVLETGQGPRLFDTDSLSVSPLPETVAWHRVAPDAIPADEVPVQRLVPAEFNWERLMRDIHAGRVLGRFGWVLMDLSAVFLLVLAGTGLVVWTRSRARSR